MFDIYQVRHGGSLLIAAVVLFAVTGFSSVQGAERFHLNIPASSGFTALDVLAAETEHSLLYEANEVGDITTNALDGYYTLPEALDILLEDTRLNAVVTQRGVIVVSIASNDQQIIIEESSKMRDNAKKTSLLSKIGLVILGAYTAVTQVVSAQDSTTEQGAIQEVEEVVVTGIRGSLKQSLDVKRDENRVVDVVSSEDVGKFPDTNIAEALQRITGVAIDRAGGEGQFITVRGLGPEFNTVLVNGRTIATDNDGREFSFDVLASDIIQRAAVYKSAIPSIQSGGIGSVVNISTARPLDYTGRRFALSAQGIYDEAREDVQPEVSGVASFTNEGKTFGALLSASYSKRKSQDERADVGGYFSAGGNTLINGTASSVGLTDADTFTFPEGRIPQEYTLERELQDRERIALNGTIQAQFNDDIELTLDALYTSFDIDTDGRRTSFFFSNNFVDIMFDENNTAIGFNRPGIDFVANNPGLTGVGASQNDNVILGNDREAGLYQFGANLVWNATESLALITDVSISKATRDSFRPFIVVGSLAQSAPRFDITSGSDIPTISNLTTLDDLSLQRAHFLNLTETNVEDEVFELRFDANWEVDAGPLAQVTAGAFFNNRGKSRDVSRTVPRCAFCGYSVPVDPNLLQFSPLTGLVSEASGSELLPTDAFTFNINEYFDFLNANIGLAPNPASVLDAMAQGVTGEFGLFTPVLDRTRGLDVEETVVAFHLNTEWEGDLGGTLPWFVNVGFRIAHTKTTSRGVDAPVLAFREVAGDTQLFVDLGPLQSVAVENDYINFLPSINVKLDVTDDIVLRFGFSETVTRPTLTALGVNNAFGGRSFAPTSTGGNPLLQAFEAQNYDAGIEWYYSDVGFLGLAFFHKEFDQFIETQTLLIPNNVMQADGSLVSRDFEDTRDRNGEAGRITGIELATQHTFDYLPGIWSGFGLGANYTYVTSDIDRAETSSAQGCDYNGLSPHSLNINGFYERGPIQARIAYNYRDEFLFQCFSNQEQPRNREAFGQVDFSVAYRINDTFEVFAEGINITNETARDFSSFSNRFLSFVENGARYSFGLRGSF